MLVCFLNTNILRRCFRNIQLVHSSSTKSNSMMNGIQTELRAAWNDLKGTLLESIARNLSDQDMQLMATHWFPKIHKVHDQITENTNPSNVSQEITLSKSNSKEKEDSKSLSKQKWVEVDLLHPIFGELVVDVGYKKTYLTNIRRLISAPVWEKQRTLRHQRVSEIVDAKVMAGTYSQLPGVITMFHDTVTKNIGIIDGQHRAGALILLAQKGLWNELSRNIMIDVFEVSTKEQISSLFYEINSSEPVKLIDMPSKNDDNLISDDDIKVMINEATTTLQINYPKMFSASQRCRPPHYNIDNLRDEIFQSNFISRLNIKSSKTLYEQIVLRNNLIAKKYQNKKIDPILKKAVQNSFYLGLEGKSWLYDFESD